jgi:Bacterial conjugation TrbI-like protein
MAGLAVTGWRSRERLAAPVAEIRDVTFSRSRSCRSGPDEPLSGNHRQDRRRAGGRSCALGSAVGNRGGESIARHAEERGDPAPLLGPQGSKLVGAYDSQVSFGQDRVLLVWTRLIMPNGRSIVLERQPGADTQGFAGLEDEVDHHWGRLFMAAALSTLLGVGSELGAASNDNNIVTALRRGSSDSLNQTGQQVVRRNLNIQPTLTIRPGFPVRVIVNRDLVLAPYKS